MALNLTGVLGDVSNLASSVSMQDVITAVATGALGTVVVSGLQSPGGQDAVDPLHIFHHAPSNSTGAVQGKVMPASSFSKLDAGTQNTLLSAGYTVIPG